MQQFVKDNTTIDHGFIDEFMAIYDTSIDFEKVCDFAGIRKDNFKNVLEKHYTLQKDYTEERKTVPRPNGKGANQKDFIIITLDCFRGLCDKFPKKGKKYESIRKDTRTIFSAIDNYLRNEQLTHRGDPTKKLQNELSANTDTQKQYPKNSLSQSTYIQKDDFHNELLMGINISKEHFKKLQDERLTDIDTQQNIFQDSLNELTNQQEEILKKIDNIKYRQNELNKEKENITNNIIRTMEDNLLMRQNHKCNNKPGSDLYGIENVSCLLWETREGSFKDVGYYVDHIFDHSLVHDNLLDDLQLLCVVCHNAKTRNLRKTKIM